MTTQAGNVLFLILIAVALFAALSYAVTSSTRSGGGNADKEKLLTDSASLIQYGTNVQSAVTRMIVSNDVSVSNLLFDNPANFGSMTAAQLARQVFHPSGGGAIYQSGWWIGSCQGLRFVGTSGSTANSTQDIIAYRPVSSQMCQQINNRLGITGTTFVSSVYQYQPEMTLAFPGICNGGTGSDTNMGTMSGKEQGCYQDIDWGPLYYQVILAR